MNTNQLLNKTPLQYEIIIWETYYRWCLDFCSNYQNDLQSVLANSKINKYFLFEYGKCETEFLKLITFYESEIGITPQEAQKLYDKCVLQIFNRTPKPLIDEAKKLKVYDKARN